jgi:hypothetical protein
LRIHRRISGRLLLGGVVGLAVGALLGVGGGLIFSSVGRPAFWGAVVCGCIFGLGVGMLTLGYSALESPDPGEEPSDTARPVRDRAELTREEDPAPTASPQIRGRAPAGQPQRTTRDAGGSDGASA